VAAGDHRVQPRTERRAARVLQVGSTDLTYLIDNYQRSTWGFASKNFYAEFLAALSIMSEGEGEMVLTDASDQASVRD